jgi:TPR repeat protein
MIAGICLWHITFYGFSAEELEETFNDVEDDGQTNDEPAYTFYLLSEETKALRPDFGKLELEEYDRQFEVYRQAYMKELTALATEGDKYGQFFLAEEYRRGVHGKHIDLESAFPLYLASAEQGFYRAQLALAFCYEYGLGTDADLDKARKMFKQAGQYEKGHGKPEEHLAILEANEGNYAEAQHWFKEAQRKGNHTVKTYIWYLERKLN